VASSKKTQQLLGCAVAPILVAAVVIFSLEYVGSDWFEQLRQWARPATHAAHSRESVKLRPGSIGTPITVTPMRPQGNDSSVSAVALPLILVRTQPGRNSREGFAQIGVDATSPQTYAAGALLANGARLTEIYNRYVVLERDGHSALLYARGASQERDGARAALLTVGGSPRPTPALPKTEDRLFSYLRLSPVFVGNQLHGYALYPNRDPGPFSRLGLQPGDLVTEINGAPISNPRGALVALHSLADGASLAVVIERQGIAHPISLDGAILAHAIAAADDPTIPMPSYTDLKRAFSADSSLATRKPGP
jgi:hypothetical protein